MPLEIHASANRTEDLVTLLARDIQTFILDVDDTIYHAGTGLHKAIKLKICDDANTSRDLTELRKEWREAGKIGEDGQVCPADLAWAFPLIVDAYRSKSNHDLVEYLRRVYAVDYSVIPPQPDFVAAVRKLRAHGKRVVFYTNGPFGMSDRPLHMNKVLGRLGFAPEDVGEEDVVDLLKPDRNPDLVRFFGSKYHEMAGIFSKPTKCAFQRMCVALHIRSGPSVAYFDDNAVNLSATEGGVLRVQTPVRCEDLVDEKAALTRDFAVWSDATDEAGRPYAIAGCLLEQVAVLLPDPAARLTLQSCCGVRQQAVLA